MKSVKVVWWVSAVLSSGLLYWGGSEHFLFIAAALILGCIGGASSALLDDRSDP